MSNRKKTSCWNQYVSDHYSQHYEKTQDFKKTMKLLSINYHTEKKTVGKGKNLAWFKGKIEQNKIERNNEKIKEDLRDSLTKAANSGDMEGTNIIVTKIKEDQEFREKYKIEDNDKFLNEDFLNISVFKSIKNRLVAAVESGDMEKLNQVVPIIKDKYNWKDYLQNGFLEFSVNDRGYTPFTLHLTQEVVDAFYACIQESKKPMIMRTATAEHCQAELYNNVNRLKLGDLLFPARTFMKNLPYQILSNGLSIFELAPKDNPEILSYLLTEFKVKFIFYLERASYSLVENVDSTRKHPIVTYNDNIISITNLFEILEEERNK